MSTQLTLAELLRVCGQEYRNAHGAQLPGYKKRALWLLEHCQSSALGGHVVQCKECGHQAYRENSCRYRGCPQCEGSKEAAWLLKREQELLPTHYFHVVFTIPHVLNELFLNNERECYSALFDSAAKTLKKVSEKRLGAKLGFFGILHTWSQLLELHPHLHFVVPGGGLSEDGKQWIPTSKRRHYFAPTKVLALVFRGILLKTLKCRFRQGTLRYDGDFEALLDLAAARRWVVHAQPPFGSPLQVLKYLSRYTRKVALSNSRLIEFNDGKVTFSYKDYANGAQRKICKMRAVELIRRFTLHLPPPGFMRIRYYGFMAGKNRLQSISRLKELIRGLLPETPSKHTTDGSFQPRRCPDCGQATLQVTRLFFQQTRYQDSS